MRISSQQELIQYVQEDVKKYESTSYPIRAGYLERFFVSKLPVKKLHPNPDDEFSTKEVGPSFRIINEYREMARENWAEGRAYFPENIIVEKMSNGGYMIINGHHRWAAATLEGIKYVSVNIVNLTHTQDLHHMLDRSVRDKRAVFDLDEVILSSDVEGKIDKNPSFWGRLFYKENIKFGRIAVLHALHKMGYDIWVYTRGYLSSDYIEKLFSFYNIKIDGIINGIGRPENNSSDIRERFERKYIRSLHIDTDKISYRNRDTRQLTINEFEGDDDDWSRNVLDIVEAIEKGK